MLNGRWVSGGYLPNINCHGHDNPSLGQVRWSQHSHGFEAFDGTGWRLIGHWHDQNFTREFEDTMQWVQKQMLREQELKKLAESNPAVSIAIDNVKNAQEQLDIVLALTQKYNN